MRVPSNRSVKPENANLFEALSVAALEQAERLAALSFERIVEAIKQATPAAEETQ